VPPLLVLTGPTGTGKSDWAVRLAETLPIEIVSMDSALVYRGMDVGTAKPERALRARIPHHLIDILEPTQAYSAGRFVADATAIAQDIRARGRIPLIVGGTMLYLRALRAGIAELPQGSPELRREIDARGAREGWPALHAELVRLDPVAASRIHPNDPQRIQRALEVCYLTGRPLSSLQSATVPGAQHIVRWALAPASRSVLHQRLEQRLKRMLEQGFVSEVEKLRARGDLTAQHPAMRAVGYRQLWAYLDGACTLAEATERALAATRQLAKRQLTWLKADRELRWIAPEASQAFEIWRQDATAVLASA